MVKSIFFMEPGLFVGGAGIVPGYDAVACDDVFVEQLRVKGYTVAVDPVPSTASTTLTQNATDYGIGVGSGGDLNNDWLRIWGHRSSGGGSQRRRLRRIGGSRRLQQ